MKGKYHYPHSKFVNFANTIEHDMKLVRDSVTRQYVQDFV